jgi:hypothetical protein
MKPPPDYVTDRRARRDAWPDLHDPSDDWLDDPRDVRTVFWTGLTIWICAAIIFGVACFAAGYALGDVPHVPAETFTNCYSEGC